MHTQSSLSKGAHLKTSTKVAHYKPPPRFAQMKCLCSRSLLVAHLIITTLVITNQSHQINTCI